VLIVEDTADTRELFAGILAEAGFRIVLADSVRQALGLLRAGTSADVILVDYSLGDGTGAELIHQARNEGHVDARATPAVLCTGYRYVELPPDVTILHKPIEPNELLHSVSIALGRDGSS
jgi:CheY-like chemotaxis protein